MRMEVKVFADNNYQRFSGQLFSVGDFRLCRRFPWNKTKKTDSNIPDFFRAAVSESATLNVPFVTEQVLS